MSAAWQAEEFWRLHCPEQYRQWQQHQAAQAEARHDVPGVTIDGECEEIEVPKALQAGPVQ